MEMALSSDRVHLLGPLQVFRNEAQLPQPASRKVRALLAYLAMAPRPVTREKLCELFWDAVDDPRSELRWCLSKLRPLVDGPTKRLIADRKEVWLDTGSLYVDALVVAHSSQKTLASAAPDDLRSLLAQFRGDFLEGLVAEKAPSFENWLASQRHRFGQLRQQLLARLSIVLPPNDRIEVLRELIEAAPFDETTHVALVRTLLRCGFLAEADHQTIAAIKRFEREGIDPTPLRSALAAAHRENPQSARATSAADTPSNAQPNLQVPGMRGPTLLVMPFAAATPDSAADADSVTSDIIVGFARLRSVSVIARGTAFSLRSQAPTAAATRVNAHYVASGRLRRDGKKYLVSIELIDPQSDRVFWADEFSCDATDSFFVPPLLAARIIAGLDAEIHIIERNRALLMPPASLDAWQTYHQGLAHMHRFTGDSNCAAQQLFTRAVALDPTFSRSYAGLSFTHFHNAFHLHVSDAERDIALAFETAEEALQADSGDPAAHCAMGRALWLQHRHDSAVGALNQAVRLSPNYAFAHYSLAFVLGQTGDPARAMEAAEIAHHLSPLDPMMFGTHRVRTFALLRLGKVKEAADCASLVGQHAGAHVHAHAVAALTLAAAGRIEEARTVRQRISALRPDYNMKQFEEVLHMLDDLRDIYRMAARVVQIPE